jgi:hypothetical protein
MALELDLLAASDKPALIGLSTPELLEGTKSALDQLGYKIHKAESHAEFLHKFAQVAYQVVVLEELFCARTPEENESLRALQRMSMGQRRQAVCVLFGYSFATLNPLHAFQHSVHAVVNPAELFLLVQLLQKTIADHDLFLHTFREAYHRTA